MLALVLLAFIAPIRLRQQRVAYEIRRVARRTVGRADGPPLHHLRQSPRPTRCAISSVHQHLNAFRPGSRWAAADSAEGRVRFQHMRDPDYAFERITQSTLGVPDYPYAPDSTIAHWTLPQPSRRDSMVVEISCRPVPRRCRAARADRRPFRFRRSGPEGRRVRQYGWGPSTLSGRRVSTVEFASYDVTLIWPADQVVGATGVAREVILVGKKRRSALSDRLPRTGTGDQGGGRQCGLRAAGRKCVRFYADFRASLSPSR